MKQTDQARDKSSASVLLPSLSSANYRLLREGFHPTKTDLVVSAKKLEFDWIIEENNPDIYKAFMRTEAMADEFIDGRVKLSKLTCV